MPKNRYLNQLKQLLKRLKKEGFTGDIDNTLATRVALSTDNSIFQVVPDGVVFPKTEADVQLVLRLSSLPEFKSLKITPKGGGTGTNGQSLNRGLIVDCSRYMRAITDFDVLRRQVTVEPGVVLSDLNDFLRPYGYFFAPHVAPENRATIGGMINTDASGKGSWRYGKTSNHVVSLNCVLEDGDVLMTASQNELSTRWQGCLNELSRLLTSNRQIISQGVVAHDRFFSGYNLKHTIENKDLNLNALLCGAEGTLGVVTKAVLSLLPIPKKRLLVAVAYDSFNRALNEAYQWRSLDPLAIEVMDHTVIELAAEDPQWAQLLTAYFPESHSDELNLVLIEWTADDKQALTEIKSALDTYINADSEQHSNVVMFEKTSDIDAIWSLRRAGVGHLTAMKGTRQPIPFVEDTLVNPSYLAAYMTEFRQILDQYQLTYGMYGHVDVGCIHIRPALDLRNTEDLDLLEKVNEQVVKLVKKYQGFLWGEHGKGFRSHYIPYFTTDAFYQLLREVKQLFDPNNRLNPEKIVSPPTTGKEFTFKPKLKSDFDRDIDDTTYESIQSLVKCNGNGVCFSREQSQLMCPSYQVTNDRNLSPKGRAMMLREWHRLMATSPKQAKSFSREVFSSLDLCLSCKACDTQCPAQVSITMHKSTFLARYYQKRLRPLKDYLLGFSEQIIEYTDNASLVIKKGLSLGSKLISWIPFTGVTHLPKINTSLTHLSGNITYLENNFWRMDIPIKVPRKSIIVLQDMMSKSIEQTVQDAAIQLIMALGFHVVVAPYFPLGKPLLVKGFIKQFKTVANQASSKLQKLSALNRPIIGLEPSAILSLRDDYVTYGIDVPMVKLISEWLSGRSVKVEKVNLESPVHLIPHCSESLVGLEETWVKVFSKFGLKLTILKTGCCGMAGGFGMETAHQAVSKACFSRHWQPHIAQKEVVLTSGLSCLKQVERYGEGVIIDHPLVYLNRLCH